MADNVDYSRMAERSRLLGKYRLVARLSSGRSGDVWLARTAGAKGRTVVVKTILPSAGHDPGFVSLIVNEALLAAALDHPNIVRILDLGQERDTHYIVTEYVSGRTLWQVESELWRSRGGLPAWLVLQVAGAVCEALDYAHRRTDETGRPLGLAHGNLCPRNIMITYSGDTKVRDFGTALAASTASASQAERRKADYVYLAPEQVSGSLRGSIADPRSDLYALGVVLYESLTGVRPFRAADELALLREIVEGSPPRPSLFAPWLSPALETLVLKAIAKNPRDRFQSASALRTALADYLGSSRLHPTCRHVAEYVCALTPESQRRSPAPTMPGTAPPSVAPEGASTSAISEPARVNEDDLVLVETESLRQDLARLPRGIVQGPDIPVPKPSSNGSVVPLESGPPTALQFHPWTQLFIPKRGRG